MLKRILSIVSIIALVGSSLAAQTASPESTVSCINKGNFAIGARIGFSANQSKIEAQGTSTTLTNGTQKASQFNITPSIGYFFVDRFMVGLGMDYLKVSQSDNSATTVKTGETSDSRLLFGPQLRYYIPLGTDQAFFLGGVSGFGNSNTTTVVNGKTQTINTRINTYGFGPGYTIFSSRCLALETQVKYNFGTTTSKLDLDGIQQTTKAKTNAVDFVVGASYYFGR